MAETLGDRIRIQRARLRMSQTDLAKRIGISLTSMSAIEAGHTDPRASRIKKMAEVLGVSTDYLLGHKDEQSESEMIPAAVALVGA
jgi:transcriptional regulator with XRE-family HTH domain